MGRSSELVRRLAIQLSRQYASSASKKGPLRAAVLKMPPPKPGTTQPLPHPFESPLSRSKTGKTPVSPSAAPAGTPGAPKSGLQTPSPVGSAPKPGVKTQTPPNPVASPLPSASASAAKLEELPAAASTGPVTAVEKPPPPPPKPTQKYFTGAQPKTPAGVDAPPGGVPPGGRPNAGSNRWLLSPAVPVDVRFVAAALAAFGAFLVYSYTLKVEELANKGPIERDFGPAIVDGEIQEEVKAREHGGDAAAGNFYTDEFALEAGKEGKEAAGEQPGAGERAADATSSAAVPEDVEELDVGTPPSNTEEAEHVAQILNSISANQLEALWNQQEQQQRPPSDAPAESSSATADAEGSAAPEAEEVKGAQKTAEHEDKKAAREKKVQETLEVVKRAIADSAGEAAISSASSSNSSRRKAEGAAVAATVAQITDEEPAQPQSLGISEDLRPAALIRKAIERGEGAGDDWAEYKHRLAQAEADAKTFSAARKQAEEFHEEEVAKLKAEAADQAQRAAQLESALRDNAASFHQILDKQDEAAARQREAELKRQAEYMATAFAEASLKERATRIGTLDRVRLKLNGLERAFQQRSQERATSHDAHKISLGTFALESALEEGRPFASEARSLQQSCSDDPLVAATVASLPAGIAEKGVLTRAQLADQWPDVLRLSRQLSYLPKGASSGMLSMGLASLASRLKVKEPPAAGPPQTVDQALAHAESALVDGRLTDAAVTLERGLAGTAAEAAVREWTDAAKARAEAEQAVKVLQAHATAKAASLS